jgi:hypothetical protein
MTYSFVGSLPETDYPYKSIFSELSLKNIDNRFYEPYYEIEFISKIRQRVKEDQDGRYI